MLIINEELWESDRIIKISTSRDWESADCGLLVQCTLDRIKEMIENNESRPVVAIVDCNKGSLPPMTIFVKMFAFLAKIRAILSVKLNKILLKKARLLVINIKVKFVIFSGFQLNILN